MNLLILEKYIPLFEFHGFSPTFSVKFNKEVLDVNPCYDVNAVATTSSSSRLVSCRTQYCQCRQNSILSVPSELSIVRTQYCQYRQNSVPSELSTVRTQCCQNSLPTELSTGSTVSTQYHQYSVPSELSAVRTQCRQHSIVRRTQYRQNSVPSELSTFNTHYRQHSVSSALSTVNTQYRQHTVITQYRQQSCAANNNQRLHCSLHGCHGGGRHIGHKRHHARMMSQNHLYLFLFKASAPSPEATNNQPNEYSRY